jgi:hypothetical protein
LDGVSCASPGFVFGFAIALRLFAFFRFVLTFDTAFSAFARVGSLSGDRSSPIRIFNSSLLVLQGRLVAMVSITNSVNPFSPLAFSNVLRLSFVKL